MLEPNTIRLMLLSRLHLLSPLLGVAERRSAQKGAVRFGVATLPPAIRLVVYSH